MQPQIQTVVKAELEKQRGDWQLIAKQSGVSYSWLGKFANDRIPNPGVVTLQKLLSTLEERTRKAKAEAV
jgi:transcriptional regulator with XRE-family HTH domain